MLPSVYVLRKSNDFCIPMISHCMMEGFGSKNRKSDSIKIIEEDKVDGLKKNSCNWIVFERLLIF